MRFNRRESLKMSHKVAFREYGHGPLLVLLHGYGGSVMHWDPVIERLKADHRVVVPNLSHLYMSKDRLLFPAIVERIADFLRTHFPGQKASIAGLSFGGTLGWGLGLKHPDLVDRLILMNPLMTFPVDHFRLPETRYFFVAPLDPRAIVRLLATPIGVSFLGKCAQIFRPDREMASRSLARLTGTKLAFVAELLSHFSWILRNEDWAFWERELQNLKIPTMMIYAKDDQLFDDAAYARFAGAINALKVNVLEQGGHIISRSAPDVVAGHCLDFLAPPPLEKPESKRRSVA